MLKKTSSVVLASLKACDVQKKVRLGFSLAAALPWERLASWREWGGRVRQGLFEHHGRHLGHDQWACFTEPC